MAGDAAEGRPVRILRPSKDHSTLEEDLDGMAALEALPGKLAVLSISGNQRGGKSTLMNLLHGRAFSGFQMGHYLDPQTSGLWVWPRPHPWQEGVTLLLIDSEGLDSPHVPQHYNWLLSALTLLASDVFMYQSRGSIEQSHGERLDMILRVAEQLSSATAEGDQAEKPATTFLWLLRDHQLRMRRAPREELFEKLDQDAFKSLRRCFCDADCVLLPRPMHSDDDLKTLETLSFSDLSPEFTEEYVVLERRLFDLLSKPRKVLGDSLSGATLASCLRTFLNALQSKGGLVDSIRCLPSQREMLIKVASERVAQAALHAYRLAMPSEETGCQSLTELIQKHNEAQHLAQSAFQAEARSVGLVAGDGTSFKELCLDRIALWEPDALSPRWPANGVVQDVAAALLSGEPRIRCDVPVPMLCQGKGLLKGGLLHEIWQKHARASTLSTSEATSSLLSAFQKRVDVTCGFASAHDVEPFKHVGEVWKDLHKIQSSIGSEAEQGAGTFAIVGALAADRVAFALAHDHVSEQSDLLQDRILEVQKELNKDAQDKFDCLQRSLADCTVEHGAALEALEKRQAESVAETSTKFSGLLSAQEVELRQAEVRFKDVVSVAEQRSSEQTASLAKEFRQETQRLQEDAAASKDSLRAEMHELDKRQQAGQVETQGYLNSLKMQQEQWQAFSKAKLESQEDALQRHAVETERKTCETEEKLQQTITRLQNDFGEHQAAVKAMETDLHQQCRNEESQRKSGLAEIQEQVQETVKMQEKPLAALQSSFAEQQLQLKAMQTDLQQQVRDEETSRKQSCSEIQREVRQFDEHRNITASCMASLSKQQAAVETLHAEVQRLNTTEGDRTACMADLQQKLSACDDMISKVHKEAFSRLQELEFEQRRLQASDLESMQKELREQLKQLDAVATLCRNAEAHSNKCVAAILTGSAVVGGCNLAASLSPLAAMTLTVLAASAGFQCAKRNASLEEVAKALPLQWRVQAKAHWDHVVACVMQRGIEPLARASKDAALEERARLCLSAVSRTAGKLRKRIATEDENQPPPQNTDSDAPLAKRSRVSLGGDAALREPIRPMPGVLADTVV